MIQFKKLAIAGAIAASIMGATAAEAHVSYHLDAAGGQAPNVNGSDATGSWTGGAPSYDGNLPVTWVANIHHVDTVYEISAADAINNKGAASNFVLESINNKWKPASSWGNALDFGLINMEVAGNLTITVEADSSLASTFAPGFTLWSGWDATATSSKHGSWNANPFAPTTRGSNELTYVGHAATTVDGGSVTYTFNNLAAGNYSLWVGGNGTDNVNEFYKASMSVAAVPVPGAVWLFGSAIAGLVGFGRRKAAVTA
ncbi:VPLPA-CTERM sorting domain-containing protein [Methylomonas sp. LL1]|uniref:VPLPA-CTERM sorting domain-containing protein n=1 Tax=Methylomonas sp. LL1 TaxID=2785785 RepID=UPI0018C37150|nr:VPLPA-CTERM sorting domain-containing protein [Methylomonas sp. LL1]QPK65383.1 VPLPA-CTERM sorting domain-containing protein [Methylomonas sp. LL1]